MPQTAPQRLTANNDDELVVFLIGAHINRFWLLPIALPILSRMQVMLKELANDPESGLLGVQPLGLGGMVQYWKSVEHLIAYADARDRTHKRTATRYYQRLFKNRAIGLWHELFIVRGGHYEGLYSNMPKFGLGQFRELMPATGKYATARGRLERALSPAEAA